MLVLDSFTAHLTDNVKCTLCKGNTVSAVISGGCMSLDISINKPFET